MSTPRGGRDEERDALLAVGRAARELDALFGGDGPGGWTLDGELLEDGPVTAALLSLHDYLNDASHARTRDGEAEQPANDPSAGIAAATHDRSRAEGLSSEDAAAVGREAAASDLPELAELR